MISDRFGVVIYAMVSMGLVYLIMNLTYTSPVDPVGMSKSFLAKASYPAHCFSLSVLMVDA